VCGMDGFISSWMVFVALALHLAVDGCSAINFEGTGGLAPVAWFRWLSFCADLVSVSCGVCRGSAAQVPVKGGGGSTRRYGRLEPAQRRSLQLGRRPLR
jgi:hypothetical protein